jgi:hypothetical protein
LNIEPLETSPRPSCSAKSTEVVGAVDATGVVFERGAGTGVGTAVTTGGLRSKKEGAGAGFGDPSGSVNSVAPEVSCGLWAEVKEVIGPQTRLK